MSTISEENIKKALKVFKSSYRNNMEKYEEENVKVEDVVTLSEEFSGKSVLLATTVIISVMLALPPREFMALMEIMKLMYKAKSLEVVQGILEEEMKEGTDNNINN